MNQLNSLKALEELMSLCSKRIHKYYQYIEDIYIDCKKKSCVILQKTLKNDKNVYYFKPCRSNMLKCREKG